MIEKQNFYNLYRNPMNAFKYTCLPQICIINDMKYILLLSSQKTNTEISIFDIEDLSIQFYFTINYNVVKYLFKNGIVILLKNSNILEFYRRNEKFKHIELENKIIQDFQFIDDEIMILYQLDNAFYLLYQDKPIILDFVESNIESLQLIKNNKILLISQNIIYIFNYKKNKCIYKIKFVSSIFKVQNTIDNNIFIIIFKNNTVIVYDIKKDKKIYNISGFNTTIDSQIDCYGTNGKYVLFKDTNLIIYDLELKQYIQEINAIFGLFLNENKIIIINYNKIEILCKNKKGFFIQYKVRKILSKITNICKFKDFIIIRNEFNVFLINPFKDEQNKLLFTSKVEISDIEVNTNSNELNCIIFVNNNFIDIKINEKNKKIIRRKADWFKAYLNYIIIGHQNNIFIIHKKSLRVVFHIDITEINPVYTKSTCCYFNETILIIGVETDIIVYEHNFIYFKLKFTKHFDNIIQFIDQINDKLYILTKSPKLFNEKYILYVFEANNIIFECYCDTFDICDKYLVINIASICKFYYNFILINVFDFKFHIKTILLIRGIDFIAILNASNNFELYTINNIFHEYTKKNTMIQTEDNSTETDKELLFLYDLNRSVTLENKNSQSFKKISNELYKEIDLYKNCISKEDVNLYLQGLNRVETIQMFKMIIQKNKVLELSHLVNRLLLYKGKYIDKKILEQLNTIYKSFKY
ncbi:hypothetical protein EBI_24209 [Enterocytozoon bieneusi H348]|nr:hypothetical protein EBI_24209 [Enterocytozoon bieneusi H348]|eukprot:XP_002649783.1 hypothetical protein EBI_24209 [Enterocytozoon bieneusi H348]